MSEEPSALDGFGCEIVERVPLRAFTPIGRFGRRVPT